MPKTSDDKTALHAAGSYEKHKIASGIYIDLHL